MTIDQIDRTHMRLLNSFGEPCTLDRDDLLLVVREALEIGLISWSHLWEFEGKRIDLDREARDIGKQEVMMHNEQTTVQALADPESDLYEAYARGLETQNYGEFATRDNAEAFAAAYMANTGRVVKVRRQKSGEKRYAVTVG